MSGLDKRGREAGGEKALDAAHLRPSIHPTYARLLVAELKRRGFADAEIVEGTRLDWAQLLEEDRFLSFEQFRRLALRALILSLQNQGGDQANGTLQVLHNAASQGSATVTPQTSDVTRLFDLKQVLKEGANKVDIVFNGKGALAYQVVAIYYLAGATDFMIHVAVRDSNHLRDFALDAITSRPDVARVETALIFDHVRSPTLPDYALSAS